MTANHIKTVVIVDDSRTIQALLDNAFSKRPEFKVVGICGDAASGSAMIRRMTPDIATIDLYMPYIDGSALLEAISDIKSVCKIVVSDQTVNNLALKNRLLAAGAAECISKNDLAKNQNDFFKKVHSVLARHTTAKPHVRGIASVPLADTADIPVEGCMAFPIPIDEYKRIKLIESKALSNSVNENQFDLITKYVVAATGFPVCLLTFIDSSTQWVKSSFGLDVGSTPRSHAFCNYTIAQDNTFVVPNATSDPRFSGNLLVTGEPNIKTYAGHPVTTKDGVNVGALCVIDSRTRVISKAQTDVLAAMAEVIGEMINLRPTSISTTY